MEKSHYVSTVAIEAGGMKTLAFHKRVAFQKRGHRALERITFQIRHTAPVAVPTLRDRKKSFSILMDFKFIVNHTAEIKCRGA